MVISIDNDIKQVDKYILRLYKLARNNTIGIHI